MENTVDKIIIITMVLFNSCTKEEEKRLAHYTTSGVIDDLQIFLSNHCLLSLKNTISGISSHGVVGESVPSVPFSENNSVVLVTIESFLPDDDCPNVLLDEVSKVLPDCNSLPFEAPCPPKS